MLVFCLGALLLFTSVIMILLVLIQRGRGGGLAGAFGGQGGQSALGVRAGDVFTKITVVIAVLWVLLAGILGIAMRSEARAEKAGENVEGEGAFAPEKEEEGIGVDGGDGPLVQPAEDGPVPDVPEEDGPDTDTDNPPPTEPEGESDDEGSPEPSTDEGTEAPTPTGDDTTPDDTESSESGEPAETSTEPPAGEGN